MEGDRIPCYEDHYKICVAIADYQEVAKGKGDYQNAAIRKLVKNINKIEHDESHMSEKNNTSVKSSKNGQ